MAKIYIERIDQNMQTYRVGLPEGGLFILEYSKRKSSNPRSGTLRMEFPGDDWERLEEVYRTDESGVHTTPVIAERYNKLSEKVRNTIMEKISPEAKNLLEMINLKVY